MPIVGSSSRGRFTPYLAYLIFVATMGPLQFGYHLAELNAPQKVMTCGESVVSFSKFRFPGDIPRCIPMSPSQFGLVSSIYTLGGLIGALAAGSVSTKYGRLWTLRATTAFFVLGPIAEAFASNIALMSTGRFMSGVGAGASIVVGPIFISEVAPSEQRGFFGAFTQIMTNVGILLAQTLGYFLSHGRLWRIILAVAGLIGILEALGLLLVPESPVWLAEHQQSSRARQILQKIRGDEANIEGEVRAWKVAMRGDTSGEEEALLSPRPAASHNDQPVSFLGVVQSPNYRPAIIAVVGVMVAQQFTGINSVIMYSVSLLSTILPTTASLLAVAISALNLVTTLACSPLPDKIGRKRCLLLSITGMGINSILLACGIAFQFKALSAIAILLFVASFAVGLGPVPFILASELVGPEAVGATQSWALGANWIATFIVAQFFPVLNDRLGGGGKVYWIFAALSLVFGIFILWSVPETKGKANVEEVWGRERPNRRED